jgi:hypothetical protein
VKVSAPVINLTANATCHYRIIATNSEGTSDGADQSFSTSPSPTTVDTGSASEVTPTSQPALGGQGVLPSQEHRTPAVPNAELASTSLTVSSSGSVSIVVRCSAAETSCIGTVTLKTLTAVVARAIGQQAKKTKAAILTLATGSFEVAQGHATTVKLRLSAKARTLLARTHVVGARATIVAHDAAGATHTAQSVVTIRPAKAKRKG